MKPASGKTLQRPPSPDAPPPQVISLGIGDTTHPLPPAVVKAMNDYVTGLGTKEVCSPQSSPSPSLLAPALPNAPPPPADAHHAGL